MTTQNSIPDIFPNRELEGDEYWAMRESLDNEGFELDKPFEAAKTNNTQVERYREKLENQGFEVRILRKPGLIQFFKRKLEKGKEAEEAEIISLGRQEVKTTLGQIAG